MPERAVLVGRATSSSKATARGTQAAAAAAVVRGEFGPILATFALLGLFPPCGRIWALDLLLTLNVYAVIGPKMSGVGPKFGL